MKRIYLLFAMLLGIFGLNNASAQSAYEPDYDEPLITDVSQFYSPMDDSQEGNYYALLGETAPEGTKGAGNDFWHSSWHGVSPELGSHYLQVEILEPEELPELILFEFTRRPASYDHTTVWGVRGTNDPDATKDACEPLAEINTPYTNNTETLVSDAFNPKGYKYLRFYSEHQGGPDPNYYDRTYFHIARFQLYPALKKSELDQAIDIMNKAAEKYESEELNYMMMLGDGPGMYSEEAYDALDEAIKALTDESVETVAEAQARVDAAEAALQALKDSRNLEYSIESGYYFIRTAMDYSDGNTKYMLGDITSSNELRARWGDFETYENEDKAAEGKARMLWKIDNNGDGTYAFVNMFKNGRFTHVVRSGDVMMCREDTTFMALEPVFTDFDNSTWVNIRSSKQESGGYLYLHQGGHSNGNGTSGTLVGWCTTLNRQDALPGASEWIFEEVDDEEAQQIIDDWSELNDMDSKIREIRQMLSEAKDSIVVAQDIQTIIEEDKPVVSNDNWIKSPCSDSSEGQHIEYLWDGKGDTFWHSSWHGEYEIEPHHYFQVEIPEDLTSAVFTFTRRNTTSGNQINKWTIWGTNTDYEEDPEMIQGSDGLEQLAEIETTYHGGNNTESYVSTPFETKGYKYLRFYVAGTCNNDGSQGGNEKFMHLAEFNVYPGELFQSETCQYNVMGATATKMSELVESFEDVEDEDLTVEDYNEVKAAYDAFMAKFVDPARLRQALASHEGATSKVVVGTDPGFWPAGSSAAQLDATIEAAKAYDAAGAYTDAESEKYIADMATLNDNIPEEANKVQEGKWYRIRFGKEEEFEQYGWPTGGNEAYWRTVDNERVGDIPIHEEIFGKYLTVAKWVAQEIDTDADGNPVNAAVITPVPADEIAEATYIYGDALEDIENPDLALFRFVNIGDSAYAIQNKATGLFLSRPTTGGDVRLGVTPVLYEQKIVGWGQNSFFAKSIQGTTLPPLHMARNYNVLTQWGGSTSGWGEYDNHRGAFYVEEVEDVASSYSFGDFKIKFAAPGDIYGRCYPVPVTVKDATQGELWTVEGIERTAGDDETPEEVKVNLAKITATEIPAGRPFIYITAGDFPEEGDEYDPVFADFSFTFDLINEPQNDKCLKGTFDSVSPTERWIGIGEGKDEKSLKFNSANSAVGDYRVYIMDDAEDAEPFAFNAVLDINYDESLEDGIATAIKNVSRTGNIYTLDGRLVGRGNLNSLTQKGVYIINGVKVTVK